MVESGAMAAGVVLAKPLLDQASAAQAQRKRILAVAVGPSQIPNPRPITSEAELPGLQLRPIILAMVEQLKRTQPAYILGTHYVIDYLQDEPANLQGRIAAYLTNPPPSAGITIFTIASSATTAAYRARQGISALVPIVFTVISTPADPPQSFVDRNTLRGNRITGVSTGLAQTVRDCRNFCKELRSGSDRLRVYTVSSDTHPAAVAARRNLDSAPDPDIPHEKDSLPQATGNAVRAKIGALPKYSGSRRNCILAIPDDTVFGFRDAVIQLAHAKTADGGREVPTFFQQLEVVRNTTDPTKSALGAYGIPAETIGLRAAEMMSQVLNDPDAASRIPVRMPDLKNDFKLVWNTAVAKSLGIDIPPGLLSAASEVFPK